MYFLGGFVDGNLFELAHHFLDFGCHNGSFCGFAFLVLSSSVVFVLPEGTFRGRLRRLSFSFLVLCIYVLQLPMGRLITDAVGVFLRCHSHVRCRVSFFMV